MEWEEVNKTLKRTFTFDHFVDAVTFVNQVGEIAEQVQHHPDIFIHDYKYVDVLLTTHDEGKVTDKDHDLASRIDRIGQTQ